MHSMKSCKHREVMESLYAHHIRVAHLRVQTCASVNRCRWHTQLQVAAIRQGPADLWLDNLATMAVEDDPSRKRAELKSSTHMRSSISSVTLPRPSRRSSAE